MEASVPKDGTGAESLIPCPLCGGLPYMDSIAAKSGECPLCGDAQVVDTSKVCLCGKPAYLIVNEVDVCWQDACAKSAAAMALTVKKDDDDFANWPGLFGGL